VRYDFCAQFDRHYLARALVLYRSLVRHCGSFRFHAYCMDQQSEHALRELDLEHMNVVPLAQLEADDPELAAVESTRSRTEYLWTAGPAICLHVLERNPDVELVTRLDSDLEFHSDPAPLFAELGNGSVLLSSDRASLGRRTSQEQHMDDWIGRFTTEFDTFRRDSNGLAALNWWRERCIEWCYDRVEPGRYADQKYLDELPQRFSGVRVARHLGGLAPWNTAQAELERREGALYVDGVPVIFHHFQTLGVHPATEIARRLAGTTRAYRLADGAFPLVWTTGWRPSDRALEMLWEPYVLRLSNAVAELRATAGETAAPLPPLRARSAAFQVVRRRLPGPLRSFYWYARVAAGRQLSRLRPARSQRRASRPGS
jgi:hypothetical protein